MSVNNRKSCLLTSMPLRFLIHWHWCDETSSVENRARMLNLYIPQLPTSMQTLTNILISKVEISHAAYLMLRAERLDTTWPVLQEYRYTVRPDPLNVNWSRLNLFNHSLFWLEMVPVGMSWSCVQSRQDRNTPQPASSAVKTELCREHFEQRFFSDFISHFLIIHVTQKNAIITLCRSFTREGIKCQMKVTHQQLLHNSCTQSLPAGD